MRRSALWLLTLPFAATSVLAGHWAAYRLAGAPADDLHGYLAHAPQVVAILALLGLLGLARDARASAASPLPVGLLAIAAFVVQEHVERLVHTGHVPFLLASPVLLLGVALQLPLALAVWLVARRLARAIAPETTSARPPVLALLPLLLLVPLSPAPRVLPAGVVPGRGPPASL